VTGPRVSVVLPCHDAGAWLGEQLAALAAQHLDEPWELVVVDNASTDGSGDLARAACAGRPGWRVVEARDGRGAAHARNVGVAEARGDLLLFCDADDVIGDGWLPALTAALDEADLVAGRWEADRLNPPDVRRARPLPQQDGLQEFAPPWLPHAGAGNLGLTRALWEKVGPFDEDFPALEDTEFCFRSQLAGHRLAFAPDAVVHVRLRGSLATTYRQMRAYGEASVALHRRFAADGMPPPDWRRGLGGWLLSVPRLLAVRDRADLGAWVVRLGWRVGRLRGSVAHRTLAL
jgi:glycosyltransferase involved in cell wall biosynthesis